MLALRFGKTRFPGQQHAERRLRSAEPAVLADLQEPDSAGQVSPGPHPRLRPGRGSADDAARSTRPRSTGSPRARTPRCRRSSARTPFKVRRRLAEDGHRHATSPATAPGILRLRQGHDVVQRRHRQHDGRQRVRVVPARLSVVAGTRPNHALSVSTPLNVFTHYFGGLRAGRLARQLEVHAELRSPPRARKRTERSRTTTSRSASIRR